MRGSHDPSKPRYQARGYAAVFKRKGTFDHLGDAHDGEPEAGMPIEMTTTYVSSGRQKDSGSVQSLVTDAAMPGITAETDIRISRAHIPR